MKRLLSIPVAGCLTATAFAQVAPSPSFEDPRLQTITYDPGRSVRLVVFPNATMIVMLLPGDRIGRVIISDRDAFDVKVTGSNDSLNIRALRQDASASLVVETSQKQYEFELDAGTGLAAAYMVRFISATPPSARQAPAEAIPVFTGVYRLSGDRALRPKTIGDDGARTYIEWDEDRPLPAVFGIGPTGKEEVVDGHMRDRRFTIDRVYEELWFRIDDKRAKARRTERLSTR